MTEKMTKISTILKLIGRKPGATTEQLQTATEWQSHSVRSALAGLRKKGHTVRRQTNAKGVSVYHLVLEG